MPKTAGTSARQMFFWMYGEFYFVFEPSIHLVGPHDPAVWEEPGFFDRYLMIGGHLSYRYPIVAAARRTGRRIVFVTTLREPVSRVVSFYDYVRKRTSHPLHVELKNRSLLEVVDRVGMGEHWVNSQLKQIFGSPAPATISKALATENYIIGRQERLDAFLDAVAAVSGIPRMTTIPRENTSDVPGEVDAVPASQQPDFEQALARIAEVNQPETEFVRSLPDDVLITTAPRLKFI